MGAGNIQSIYSNDIPVAFPGTRYADKSLIVTKIAEGDVNFGIGVKRGTDKDTQAIAGGGAGFLGVALHSLVAEAAYVDATIKIEDTETMEILRNGMCWVSPTNAVVAGDKIIVVDSTGAFKGGTASAGETQLDGTFESSCGENGLALILLNSSVAKPFITATAVTTAKSFVKDVSITPFTPLTAANGNKPYQYYVSAGTLPVGLFLNPVSGAVFGIPTTAATATTVTFSAKDAEGNVSATTSAVAITITAS